MQSPLGLRNWIIFIFVTIFVAALTAFIVVRVLTQAASQPNMAVVSAPLAATAAPVPTQAAPADATVAAPAANTTPQSVLVPAATEANAALPQPTPAQAASVLTATAATTSTNANAAPAKVRISTVIFPGQRTREVVVIVNEGDQADLSGWTISNPRGKTYTFGNVLLLKENFINLHTTKGVDVPTDLFWNQEEAVWQAGDVATLKRGDEVMATFEVK